MANAPEGMTILEVIPRNYDRIIELSRQLPSFKKPNPYTVEELDRMRAIAKAKNTVTLIAFTHPDFWKE